MEESCGRPQVLGEVTAEQLEKQVHGGVSFRAKSGFRVDFHGEATCPVCKHPLRLKWILEDAWPYAHCDFQLVCPKCMWAGTFGLATNPLFGLELIIWDTHPLDVLKQALEIEPPICPFHTRKMWLTKIWGDKVMEPPTFIRVQWKCPEWFLTAHKTVKRQSVPDFELSKKEKLEVTQRLKKLGYM